MIQLKKFTFNDFGENTYVLYDETKSCIIIDPGCYEKDEQLELKSFIETNNLSPVKVVNTHCHVDHVLGNQFCKTTYAIPLYTSREEEDVLRSVKLYAPMYGFSTYEEATVDHFIGEKDVLTFGNSSLQIMFLPGHSVGHLAFYSIEQNFCLGGDVLFYQSVGRWDLPGGNQQQLLDSIQKKMFTLPDTMVVHPGHGPETTIGFEKKSNPFCAIN